MRSQSIGTGRLTEGTLTLRANASAPEDPPEQFHSQVYANGNGMNVSSQVGIAETSVIAIDETKPSRPDQSIIGYEEPIMLTQSTHSFLFTEPRLVRCHSTLQYSSWPCPTHV